MLLLKRKLPDKLQFKSNGMNKIQNEAGTAYEPGYLTQRDKIDLIDRIYKAKMEIILWIVGVGILQMALYFLTRHYGA